MPSRSTSRVSTSHRTGVARPAAKMTPLVLPELPSGVKALTDLLLSLESAGGPPVCVSPGLGEKALEKVTTLLESKTRYRVQQVNRRSRFRALRIYMTAAPGSLQIAGGECIRSATPEAAHHSSEKKGGHDWASLRHLFTNLDHIAVQGYEADGTVRFWNRASEQLYGYPAAEAMGKNLLDLIIPPAMRKEVRRAVRDFVKKSIPIPAGELTLRHQDGSPVPVFSHHILIHLPDGSPLMLCIDISQSEQVRQRDSLTRTLFLLNESIKEKTCLYRLSQLQVEPSDPDRLLESAAALIPSGWQFPEETVCRIRYGKKEFRSRSFQRPGPGMTEKRLTTDGVVLEISVFLTGPKHRSAADPFLPSEYPLLEAMADLMVLRLNQYLQEQKIADYHTLLEQSQQIARVGSWSYHADTRQQINTDELFHLFEIDRERFIREKDSFLNYVDLPYREELRHCVRQALQTGEPFGMVYTIKTPRGNRKIIQDHVYAEKDAGGRVIRVYGTAQDISDIRNTEQELRLSEEKYRRLFNASPLPKFIVKLRDNTIVDTNEKALVHYGYTREEFIGMPAEKLRPPEEVAVFHQAMSTWEQPGQSSLSGIFVHSRKDGTRMDIELHAQRITFEGEECVLAISHDVTRRNRMEAIEKLERRVLERSMDPGISITELFDDYLREINLIFPRLSVSILRVENGRLYNLSSPNLPEVYQQAIEGLEIGPAHGSCGTAAFTGKTVIVSDIASHPYWADYRDFALPHNLRACWSQPIFNADGQVVATFAIYYTESHEPGEDELNFFTKSAYLVSLILSGFEKTRALALSNERYEYVLQATSEAIWDFDVQNNEVFWGDGFSRLFGMKAGLRTHHFEEFLQLIHPDDRTRINELLERVMAGSETVISQEYRILRPDGEYAYVADRAIILRNGQGRARRVIGSVQDITEKKKREKQRELMERIIVSASDAVVVTEANGENVTNPVISYVNAAFTAMTGYTEAELLGQSPRLLQGPRTDKQVLRRLGEAVRTNSNAEVTLINYRKNGEEFWNNIRIYPVPDESGKTSHWIALERDVSEQQYRLQQADLFDRLSACFGAPVGLRESLRLALQELVVAGEYAGGTVWLLSEDGKQMLPAAFYDHFGHLPEHFRTQLLTRIFRQDEGLVGQVWSNAALRIVRKLDDISFDPLFGELQRLAPMELLGLPLLHQKKVVGVMIFGSDQVIPPRQSFVRMLEGMENFLGSEVIRKKLEHELSLVFNTVPDLLTVAGLDGYLKKINPAFSATLGYTEEELLQRPFTDFVHPDDRSLVIQDLRDLQGIDKRFNYELRGITRAGKVVWLAWSATSFFEEGLIFGAGKDITRQKELQEQLNHTYSLAQIGTWEQDMATGVRHISPITREILGVGAAYDSSRENPLAVYRSDRQAEVQGYIDRAVLHGTSFDFEAPIITPEGTEKWVRSIGQAEMADGRCVRLYGNIQDITKIKTAELLLKNSHDNIPGVLYQYYLYPDGRDEFRNVSKGAERILGIRPEVYAHSTEAVWSLIVKEDIPDMRRSLLESARTLGKWNQQWRMRHADGHLLWLEGHATPQRLPNGTVYWDTAVFDITENKRMEALVHDATSMSRIGAWQLEMTGHRLVVSDMLLEILEARTVPATLEDVFILADRTEQQRLSQYIQQAQEEGLSWDMEALMQTRSGSLRWVRIIGKPEMAEGQCVRLQGSCQDIHARKMVALELEESYRAVARFKEALDQSTNLVISDPNGYIVDVNDRTCELTGYSREELIGQHTRINRSDTHDDAFFASMWKTITGGHIWRGEIQNRRKDGSLYWVDTIIVPILDEKDTIIQYMALRIDITARKEAELALQRAYQERNSILESIGDGFFAVDRDLRVTYWNKQAETIIGVRRDEIIGRIFPEVFPAAFERIYTRRYRDELRRGRSCSSEEYLPALDKWIDLSAYPSATGFSVFFKDVTSRKEAVELLRISNERFEKITEATNDAIWDWDIDKKTIYRGGGFRTLFGYEPGTVHPESPGWNDHVHPDDQERLSAIIRDTIDNETAHTWQAEYRFRRSDGQYAFVADRGLVIRNDQGRAVRMVGAIMDITFRKEYEQSLQQLNESLEQQARELAESNAQLEQFAYVASHDLQEPLRMVNSFLAQLEKRYHDQLDDKARQYIGFATDGAARMRNMILALLEYSRVGRTHKETEPVILGSVMDEIRLLQAQLIGEKGARIEVSPLPVIRSNRISILQLFNNLVSNALKFSADDRPPLIRIQARETDTHWQFSVEDNGIGIEPEYFERIFVIFQRLHNRERFEGTGMGLAIVKRIVETLGGRIWLESRPGEGTTFFFTLAKQVANTP